MTVAVSSPEMDTVTDSSGVASVYNFNGSEWKLRGESLLPDTGYSLYALFGSSLSLSGDGKTLAVGAIKGTLRTNADLQVPTPLEGYAVVYEYSSSSNMWKSVGEKILGESDGSYTGSAASLSRDGKKVAVGANFHGIGGHVRVFEYDGDDLNWVQVGVAIDEESFEPKSRGYYDVLLTTGMGFGSVVSMVDVNGSIRIAIGAPTTRRQAYYGLDTVVVGEAFIFQEIRS